MLTLAQKLLQAGIVILVISFCGFAMFQFIGDPVVNLTGPETTEQEREALRGKLGLDQPTIIQFARYAGRALKGDFGVSYVHKRPVVDVVAERVPATLELVLLAMLVAVLIAVPCGAYCAITRKGAASTTILAASVLGVAIPTFLVAIGLVLFFSVWLQWLPSFGRGETHSVWGISSGLLTADGLKHAAMPAAVMCLFQVGVIVRLVRGEMLEVLRHDFIRFCWARGLPAKTVYVTHALRNTMMPVVTAIGVQVSTLLAFSIVTERVFQWPGLGQLLLQSIEFADIPVLSAYLVFVGLVFMATNLAVDFTYYWLDPRVRAR